MSILTVNCGSSSLKYKLFRDDETVLGQGTVDRIGLPGNDIVNHDQAVKYILGTIDTGDLKLVGHRFVHGGERFSNPVLVGDATELELENLLELAPLHNPPNLTGIKICRGLLKGVPQVAVFDTAFHQTIPEQAYLYGLPYELYNIGIRRYGFHGISHKYVSQRALQISARMCFSPARMITCHLGNGSSITAVKDGISVENSMGYTPLEGLVMGTRSGSIDPALVPLLEERLKLSSTQVIQYLNKNCGVLGISGVSSDFRDLEQHAREGDRLCQTALKVFVHSVIKCIGAYSAVLGGLDMLVFTGGIGENSTYIRRQVCSHITYLGVEINDQINSACRGEQEISVPNSTVKVFVIPTNEELMIAREALKCINTGA
ncbi:MAG: acetate kinase [Firmicutes bacterium]|nr:acetate kinase [Bacillota bacterium]